jgi:quercetin 2,3-dioxygenase
LLGADLQLHAGLVLEIPLARAFEHAVLVLDGNATLDGHVLEPRQLYYLGTMRSSAAFASRAGAPASRVEPGRGSDGTPRR